MTAATQIVVYTEEVYGLRIGAEGVGGDAVVSSVVVGVDVNNAQAQRQPVVAVVVRLDAMLRRADEMVRSGRAVPASSSISREMDGSSS